MPCCLTRDSDKITTILTVFFYLQRISLYRAALFAKFKGLGFSVPSIILVKAGLMQITM